VQKIVSWLKSFNEWLAIAAGSLLLGSVLVTLFDIIVRQFWVSLGGTDELSGYAMAISTSWGISYALLAWRMSALICCVRDALQRVKPFLISSQFWRLPVPQSLSPMGLGLF
jgi:TRAP-type C4-dicarboxylate transport system permease small subunit